MTRPQNSWPLPGGGWTSDVREYERACDKDLGEKVCAALPSLDMDYVNKDPSSNSLVFERRFMEAAVRLSVDVCLAIAHLRDERDLWKASQGATREALEVSVAPENAMRGRGATPSCPVCHRKLGEVIPLGRASKRGQFKCNVCGHRFRRKGGGFVECP